LRRWLETRGLSSSGLGRRVIGRPLVLLFALAHGRPALGQSWSATATALAVRDVAYESISAALPQGFLRELGQAGARSVLVVKRVAAEDAVEWNVNRALRELASDAARPELVEASRRALKKHFVEQLQAERVVAFWYVFGTAATFPEVLAAVFKGGAAASPARGHVIRATAEEERVLWSAAALHWAGHPLRMIAEATRADLLVVDDPTANSSRVAQYRLPPVRAFLHVEVGHLGAVRTPCRAVLGLRGLDLGSLEVLDLLPASAEEARSWGHGAESAAELARGAERLRALLARLGPADGAAPPATPGAAVERVNAAAARGRRVLLFADSFDGTLLRLPGDRGALAATDVKRIDPGASFLGAFYGASSPPHLEAFGLLGAASAGVPGYLRVSLDRGGRPTRSSFLEVDVGSPTSVLYALRESLTDGPGRDAPATAARRVARLYEFDARALAAATQAPGGDENGRGHPPSIP